MQPPAIDNTLLFTQQVSTIFYGCDQMMQIRMWTIEVAHSSVGSNKKPDQMISQVHVTG